MALIHTLLNSAQFLGLLVVVLIIVVLLHQIFLNRSHKLLILLHGFQGLLDLLERKQVWEVGTELQLLVQVGVFIRVLSDSALNQNSVEILSFHDLDSLVLVGLGLNVLQENDFLKDIVGPHLVLNAVEHEHSHYLDTLIVQFSQIYGRIFLFLLFFHA